MENKALFPPQNRFNLITLNKKDEKRNKSMKYNTAGNTISEPIQNCDCGLTGGCVKCNPLPSFIGSITDKEAEEMKKKVADFKKRFNEDFEKKNKKLFPKSAD